MRRQLFGSLLCQLDVSYVVQSNRERHQGEVKRLTGRNGKLGLQDNQSVHFCAAIQLLYQHLTHMLTHFYFAKGDWVTTYFINQQAWNKSIQRAADLSLSDSSPAFHEHLWRVYALLQAGRYEEAWSDSSDLYQKITQLLSNSQTSEEDTRVMRTYPIGKSCGEWLPEHALRSWGAVGGKTLTGVYRRALF